ncbi:MAG: hypothetical protein HW380_1866 [Magnetococcales bacterium]|nr:hypothetical protein [Magnetococcales bacterium]
MKEDDESENNPAVAPKPENPIIVRSFSCVVKFLVVWVLAMAFHLQTLWMIIIGTRLSPYWGPVPYQTMHILLSAALALVAMTPWFGKRCGQAFFLLLAGATLFLGLVGLAGVLVVFLLFLDYSRHARPFEEWYAELFPEENRQYSEELADTLRIAVSDAPGGLSPFQDILAFGNQGQKLAMIALVTRYFRHQFAPILLEAVNSPDNAIRVQAATGVSHVENNYTKRAIELEGELKKNPENPDLLWKTACHIDEYAFCGLLDDLNARNSREKALDYYRRYLAIRPENSEAVTRACRLLLKNGRLQECLEMMEPEMQKEEPSTQMIAWRMDVLFRLRQYGQVNDMARNFGDRLKKLDEFPVNIIQAIQLWREPTR